MVELKEDEVQCKTTKEIKAMARPEFQANPEKFYPTKVFEGFGFHRAQCPKCTNFYWRHSETRTTCGDSNCDGKYGFIGNGLGKGKKITFSEAWQGFEKSFTNAKVPCESIKRYPVVARWRNDVDYVAAGIFCFQPYCVTGELDPPANPLICPQFCVRFNDLDNIGVTGRHYSGFIMLGIQVFNKPNDYKFFKDECIEFNYKWLTEELGIDPDEITFVEDVWAGGGNLGPSVEYFVRGLEVGNMVFMQYKTFHDGSRADLDIKVIDVGIGLERIAWLYNGSATSYMDTFATALKYFQPLIDIEVNEEIWEKFGPYSCTLDIDETEDIEKTWADLAAKIGYPVDVVKNAIQPVKDMYIILDHTRTILITISDGSLPSNVGGGGNVRNILRRCFSVLKKYGWWEKIGKMDGFLKIFEMHKKDLEGIYGVFPEYKSFGQIIQVEYERWLNTDDAQTQNLKKLLQKKKNKLTMDDWILCIQSWGIPADKVAELSKSPCPGNLYYEIASRQERVAKAQEAVLYDTLHLPATENIYFKDNKMFDFDAEVVAVFKNVTQQQKRNILILNQSCFYPTSGGQQNDTGLVTVMDVEYKVVNCVKVGKCVLHILDKELEHPDDELACKPVKGQVDQARRMQLQAHHTGTHIIFASCKKVLGPHIWQAGAKKTTEQAHLDITHYRSITKEEEIEIENMANRIISDCVDISKGFMDKAQAELQYGFSLYQGGIVPGNSLRVVNIEGIDTEACCGTHADNTAEVGWIRMIKTCRISDGIVRLYYVAQERAIQVLNGEQKILTHLCDSWGVDQTQIEGTANRFFNEYKRLSTVTKKQDQQILSLQVRFLLKDETKCYYVKSEQPDPTLYISFLPQFALDFQQLEKGVVFLAGNFIMGLFGKPESIDLKPLEELANAQSTKAVKCIKRDSTNFKFKEKGKKPIVAKNVCQFIITGADFVVDKFAELLETQKIVEME